MSAIRSELLDAAVELLGRAGRRGTVRVQGSSMLPTLKPGQLLTVEFSPERLRRGNLLLYRQVDYLVVHRLLGRTRFPDGRPALRTRGDGLAVFDPWLDPAKVVGRVLAVSEDGIVWRGQHSLPARAYACCLAWHALFWAYLGILSGIVERALRKYLGMKTALRALTARLDRALLSASHQLCFRPCHARVDNPLKQAEGE